jgi:hypothetical protein
MQVKNFEDLEIWKDARLLTRGIYQLTRDSKFSKDFALRDQIRRAAVSIMSNIAEGFERGGNQEFIQFCMWLKRPAGKYALSFMWPWINRMWHREIVMTQASLYDVYQSWSAT